MNILLRMNPVIRRIPLVLIIGGATLAPLAAAEELPEPVVAENPAFQPVAESRADEAIKPLDLKDAGRAARVRRYVLNFIIDAKNINEGSKVPENEKRGELEQARAALYAGFEAEKLDEEQRLVIKNGLSANHFRINYDAFLELVPNLTPEQKAYIHEQLAEVTHEAILLNSGSEKGELFVDRRGRINNYLSDQGYDLKALSVARNQRIRSQREQ